MDKSARTCGGGINVVIIWAKVVVVVVVADDA